MQGAGQEGEWEGGEGCWGRVVRLAHSASDNINFGCNLESSNNSNSNSSPRENKELNRCERRVKAESRREGGVSAEAEGA